MRTFTKFFSTARCKPLVLILGMVTVLNGMFAQVSQYSFSQAVGTYTAISGGTLLGTESSDDQRFVDPAVPLGGTTSTGVGFPIGFTFNYNGIAFDRLAVNTNGWICLGQSALTPSVDMNTTSAYTPLSSTAINTPTSLRNRVAGMAADLQAQVGATLRLETIGSAPNRVCVIQWTNYKRFSTAGTGQNLTYQIRLNEAGGSASSQTVAVVFGTMVYNATSSTAQVGLGGTVATDFNNRQTVAPHDWNATIAGTANTSSCTFVTTATAPVSGLTFTWLPPLPCVGTPSAGATTSTINPACSNAAITLGITGTNAGTGIGYQWQSSSDGVSYTNITGAIGSTYSTTQAVATWYRNIVTCIPSGLSATSTPLFVAQAAPTQCYCAPVYTSGCGLDDRIDVVSFGVLVNPATGTTGCTNTNGLGYTQYLTGLPIPSLVRGSSNPISVTVGPGGIENVRIFVDWNQDGDFVDASEDQFIGSGNGVTISGSIAVPVTATFGQTRMRVRLVFNTSVFDACSSQSFGEAEDYLVSVVAPPSCATLIAPANNSSGCPGATTLSWNAAASATGYDVYFGTTNTPPLVSSNQAGTTYNAGNLAVGTYFWRIEPRNGAGTATGCTTWTFSRADGVFPTIGGCPAAPLTAGTAAPACTAVVNFPTLTPNDNCTVASFTQTVGLPSGSAFPLGNNQVRFRVTDGVGLTAECIFTVVVSDDDAPSITCPANITVGTAAPACSAVATYSVTATDNCSAATVTMVSGLASGSTYPLGTTSHVYRAADATGNSSTCGFNVIVSDDDAPIITTCPPDIQLSTNANCEAQLGDYRSGVVANDNCSTVTVSQSPAPGSIVPGFSSVTMIATDAAGNSRTCTFQISAVDGTPPTITCPAEQFVPANAATCTIQAANYGLLAVALDNCGSPTVTQSPAIGATLPYGQSTIVLTATDGPGFTATCSLQVTVVDVTAPVITCPANQTLSTGTNPNTCTGIATFICSVAPDACSGSANPQQIDGLPSGSAFPRGVNVVVFSATDQAGNSSTCSFTITVIDDQAPYLGCPQNIMANTNPGLCTAVVTWTPVVTSDNCDVPTLVQTAGPVNGSAFPRGITTVSFSSTDGSGNNTTCSFTVMVIDNELPVITCPANIVRSTDLNLCSAVVTYTVTATDNCPGVTTSLQSGLASGAAFPRGVTTNVWRATDASGNTATCSFTVTVNDTQAPTITCPANIVRSNDPGQCGATVTYTLPTFSDNCPGAVRTQIGGLASGAFYPIGTTTNTFRVTDAAGNSSTCSFTVTVNDTQFPVIGCPANITVNNINNQCGAPVTFPNITATDNCPGVVITFVSGMASGSFFPVGVTTIVYRATDAAGNSVTCSFTITVRDTQKPNITCPPSIVKNNDWNRCSAAIPFIGTSLVTDNCGIAAQSNNAIGVYPVGTTVVTFNVTDVNGNTNSCTMTVKVNDYQPPTINCPANISAYSDPAAFCGAQVPFTVTATDNCPGVTVVSTAWPQPDNGYYPIGVTMIMATATDAAGNTSGCMFRITVIAAPEICNGLDDDCDGLIDEDQDFGQVVKSFEANGKTGDVYGTSVAIWGDYAIVGAKGEAQGAGAAYILQRNQGGNNKWGRISRLAPAAIGADDAFGTSVAIHGDWAVVGATGEGKAFLFKKDQGGANKWGLVTTLEGTGGAADDNFGASVAISGQFALVGASMNDEKGLNAGAAYVFNKDQGGIDAWGQVIKLTGSDTQEGDMFGTTVDLDGNVAAVGAPLNDEKGLNAGAVYLFNGGNSWNQSKKLTAGDANTLDNYGVSVSVSGTTLAVGANMDDDKGTNSGSVYVYDQNQGGAANWGQTAKLRALDGTANDQLGYAMAVNGRYLAAGARYDDPRGFRSGAMYLFYRQDNGLWIELSKFFEANGGDRDYFGSAVDIYKGTIIAGSPSDDFGTTADRGSAAIYAAGCDGNFNGENIEDRDEPVKVASELAVRAFPQPFSNLLNITVETPAATDARIVIWNAYGQEVETVFNGKIDGAMTFEWNSGAFASGAYYLRVETGDKTEVKPLLLVR